jgi:hypothetical protein
MTLPAIVADPPRVTPPAGTVALASGSENFCRALVAYFNREMSVAAVAKFAVIRGAYFYHGTHSVVMDAEVYTRYSTTARKLHDSVIDFRAGFDAAR